MTADNHILPTLRPPKTFAGRRAFVRDVITSDWFALARYRRAELARFLLDAYWPGRSYSGGVLAVVETLLDQSQPGNVDADDGRWLIWPSVSDMATAARVTPRYVRMVLDRLAQIDVAPGRPFVERAASDDFTFTPRGDPGRWHRPARQYPTLIRLDMPTPAMLWDKLATLDQTVNPITGQRGSQHVIGMLWPHLYRWHVQSVRATARGWPEPRSRPPKGTVPLGPVLADPAYLDDDAAHAVDVNAADALDALGDGPPDPVDNSPVTGPPSGAERNNSSDQSEQQFLSRRPDQHKHDVQFPLGRNNYQPAARPTPPAPGYSAHVHELTDGSALAECRRCRDPFPRSATPADLLCHRCRGTTPADTAERVADLPLTTTRPECPRCGAVWLHTPPPDLVCDSCRSRVGIGGHRAEAAP